MSVCPCLQDGTCVTNIMYRQALCGNFTITYSSDLIHSDITHSLGYCLSMNSFHKANNYLSVGVGR